MNIKFPLSHRNKEPESGVMYVVGTPIGNLNDISFRCIDILKNVDLIACEDTRQTRKLMSKFRFHNHLISFNQHNSLNKIPSLIQYLESGKSIAIVSDAGLPGISDPGENLVNAVRLKGLEVISIPGPCAALTALVSSGLQASKFIFEGFLPKKKIDREKVLNEISKNTKTTIVYESPHRLYKLLEDLELFCGKNREIHIARELTKKYEEHFRTTIGDSKKYFKDQKILGEFTVIIKGIDIPKPQNFDKNSLKKDIVNLINAGLSLSSAAKYLSKKENLPKNIIYNLHKNTNSN
tara:strand:- start:1011 stop:1892 length:882 start_codon:yes stop_codon:yes gene_type:complete